jgi:hypothetical protein
MGTISTAIRGQRTTELERLGSDRGLIALTGADLSEATIRRRLAASDLAVATQFSMWADQAEDPAADLFERAATQTREHAENIGAPLETAVDPASEDMLAAAMASQESLGGRLGAGLVGYPLVADGRYLQVVSFFVNEADERGANQFREVRTATQELLDSGEDLLGTMDEQTQTIAKTAALDLVDAAYSEYVSTLEGLGLDPKTVC